MTRPAPPEVAADALALAIPYAAHGVPAFPIVISWDAEKRKTNKRPLTPNGFRDATCDPEILARMFNRRVGPDQVLAVGLHPGPAGYVIVDLDVNETVDGVACWVDLCAEHNWHGDVPTVMTASGGRHLWFRKPTGVSFGNAHDLGIGIDVRADDGYVVAPGTVTPWGAWEWDGAGRFDDDDPAPDVEVPPWVVGRLHPSGTTSGPGQRTDLDAIRDPANRAAVEALLALGGHGLYRATYTRDGAAVDTYALTRPGKIAGLSASVGFIAPGVAKVFSSGWPGLAEGRYNADDLRRLAEPDGSATDQPERRPTSWAAVDLADVIGKPLPRPRYLTRTDGAALFYAGRDHTLFGPSGSHKSWVAVVTVAQALADPDERVAYIDFEDTAHGIASRLEALGVPTEVLLDRGRLRYIRPNEPVGANRAGLLPPGAVDLGDLAEWRPTLVVLDGVTESMAVESLSGNDGGDVARWFLLINRRLTDVGACVVTVDHTSKAGGDGAPSELGSQHKRAGLSGASFFVDAVTPLRRATGPESEEGLVRLRLMKDRVGWLAGANRGPNPAVADLALSAAPDGAITWAVGEPDGAAGDPVDKLTLEVARFLHLHRDAGQQSRSAIAQGINRNRTDGAVGAKLTAMVSQHWLRAVAGPRNGTYYSLTALGLIDLIDSETPSEERHSHPPTPPPDLPSSSVVSVVSRRETTLTNDTLDTDGSVATTLNDTATTLATLPQHLADWNPLEGTGR